MNTVNLKSVLALCLSTLILALPTALQAEEAPAVEANDRVLVISIDAEITEVNHETREVTLKGPTGEFTTVTAGENIERFEDFVEYSGFFFTGDVAYDEKACKKLIGKGQTPPQTAKMLRTMVEGYLDPVMQWNTEALEEALRRFCEEKEFTAKELFMPVRIAVTGRAATPPLFETMEVLGKEICRRRLRTAIELLRTLKVS